MSAGRPGHRAALDELADVVGAPHVLADPELRASYETDWTGRFSGPSLAVVRPCSTADVAGVLAVCNRHRIAVIPQGGNTGLVGGSVPRHGADPLPVVLSTRRLTGEIDVDPTNLLLRAEAGTTLGAAAAALGGTSLELGIDLAARDSATLGGMAATNAGGVHVIRHGPMRQRLAGLEAVLADGTVLRRMDGLFKDNVGWDLVSLLAGSEGTLGVVTAVAMRLVPVPRRRVTALAAVDPGPAGDRLGRAGELAVELLAELRQVDGLEAVEIVDRNGIEIVTRHAGLPAPPGDEATALWLTVEAGASIDPVDQLARALDQPVVGDVAVAADSAGRARLWAYRERVAETIAMEGIPHKLDLSVPIDKVPALLGTIGDVVEAVAPGARTICFGHLGDGNIHVNVLGPEPDDLAVDEAALRHVLRLGGSISAEHGVGVAKAAFLSLARSPAELDVARRVKAGFDPNGILNPGVLV